MGEPVEALRCRRCKRSLPLNAFNRNVRNPHGRESMCRECWHRMVNRKYREQKQARRDRRQRLLGINATLVCSSCKRKLPAGMFNASAGSPNGCKAYCKQCTALRNRRPRSRFAAIKATAKRRGVAFCLSFDEWYSLVRDGKCSYCNGPLELSGGGVDRKDGSRGYVLENCVACCNICNTVKMDNFSYEEMVRLGELIESIMQGRALPGGVT